MIQGIGRIKELIDATLYTRDRAYSIDVTLIEPGRAIIRPSFMVSISVR